MRVAKEACYGAGAEEKVCIGGDTYWRMFNMRERQEFFPVAQNLSKGGFRSRPSKLQSRITRDPCGRASHDYKGALTGSGRDL